MYDYSKIATETLQDVITYNPQRPLIIYPFGERGKLVKAILNTFLGIQEALIIDNNLASKYPKRIRTLDALQDKKFEDSLILITSDNPQFFSEIRDALFAVFPKVQCVEVFLKIIVQRKKDSEMRQDLEYRKKHIQRTMQVYKKIESCYHMKERLFYQAKKTHSLFFLPFLFMDLIQQTIFLTDDYYEISNLQYIFDEFHGGEIRREIHNGIIVDIGANIGNHSLFFLNEANVGKVIAFEPIYETFVILQENIEINHLEKRVEIYRCALGDKEESAVANNYDYSNIGGTGLTVYDNEEQAEEWDYIPVRSLDSFCISDRIALMKIDVEGMEISVLKGAKKTIERNKPYILIESFENNFEKAKVFLEQMGYEWEEITTANYLFFPKT